LLLTNCCCRAAHRVLVSVVLLAVGQAQTPAIVPPPTVPTGVAVKPVQTKRLADATFALAGASGASGQSLHLLVGRSTFIGSTTRLKRIYVSNPLALDSFTSTPKQIVLTAKAPGVSSLILWDEWGQSASYEVFSDLDVISLQKEIRQALPHDDINVEAELDRVSLSGTVLSEASADAAAKMAALYAKVVVNSLVVQPPHISQVKLQVEIIEVDRSRMEQFGINLFSEGKNQSNTTTGQFPSTQTYTPATGSAPASLTSSNPLNLLFFRFGTNVGLTIQDLQGKNIAQILAEPTITTLSGQKASFLAGGEFPFPVVQGSSGGLTSITIQFRPYGVKLDFIPYVNEDGTVQLKVAPEVSALDYTNAVTISGYTIPAISTRRAETQVELRNGQSFAISGLLDHRTTDIFNKMPGIADIPVLGQLFRSKNVSHSVVELMVIVTPTIVDPLNDGTPPTPPKLPMPMLDPSQFDKKTGKDKTPTQPPPGKGGVD
jgi:pilus assembly protein CpaC